MKRKEFMAQIKDFTREIVEKAKNFEGDSVNGNFAPLDVKCPKCGGGPFEEDYRTFKCRSCGLIVWKTMAGTIVRSRRGGNIAHERKGRTVGRFPQQDGPPLYGDGKLGEEFKPEFEFENDDGAGARHDRSCAA